MSIGRDENRREFVQDLAGMAVLGMGATRIDSLGLPSPDTKPVLYPVAEKFVETLAAQGGKPLYEMSYAAAREVLEKLQSGPVDKPPVDVKDEVLPVGPGGKVSVRIYRPQGVTGALPAVVYIHGGGWVLGSANTHDRLLRDLTRQSQLAFVFVNYTPSPEAQYPVPLEQAYAVAKYVAEQGKSLNLDGRRLAIAGDSVGGNMTAALTLLAKERGGPAIRWQVMFYPVTDANFDTPSYNEFANGPWLTKAAMKWFWDAYAPNVAERARITASPLRATTDQVRGLPPGLLITDANDVLRDEGEAYGLKLIAAGVDMTVQRYFGVFHDFVMLNAVAGLPAPMTAIATAAESLKAVLHG